MKTQIMLICILLSCLQLNAKEPLVDINWCSTDYIVDMNARPTNIIKSPKVNITAWKGERVCAKIYVWSQNDISELKFDIEELENTTWIDKSTTGFMGYVMTDELEKNKKTGCGSRPDKTLYDSSYVADRIDVTNVIKYKAGVVQPIWITFNVPYDAKAGVYAGKVYVKCDNKLSKVLQYSIKVLNRALPDNDNRSFHLDLWQNPFAVARYANVPLWSKEHFDAMKPLMERLAKAGQNGITTSITYKPWNGQTYDYFNNMITEIKRVDGSWQYDYTVFDKWVEFMRSSGVKPYIYCYSVLPWQMTFRYYDQASNEMVDKKMDIASPEFEEYWTSKLKSFATHLKNKGWFENTIIAMDERPKESMLAALKIIRKAEPNFKISLAGVFHKELDDEIFDYCIGYNDKYPEGVVDARRAKGKITTFYTCCAEAYPNTFTFSQPIEATLLGLVAAERGLDGYLRWAYNSWVENPIEDSRFRSWAGGDTYLVYPLNLSSARFEKLIEGIQMYEKIKILKNDNNKKNKLEKLLRPLAHDVINPKTVGYDVQRIKDFVNSK